MMNPFDLEEYAYKVAKNEIPHIEDIENSYYDYHKNDYASRFQAELEKFFDTEYGEAFQFDNSDFADKGTKAYEAMNDAKKAFMLDIYHYADFDDFNSFNDYKKSAGEYNLALNYLPHIPNDFHLKLLRNNEELFESIYGNLTYKEIESKVEELFFKLHNEIYDKFQAKEQKIINQLPLFIPYDLNETAFLARHFDLETFDLKNITLPYFYNDISDETKEILKNSLILEDIGEALIKNAKKDLEEIIKIETFTFNHISVEQDEREYNFTFIQDENNKKELIELLKSLDDEDLASYIEKHDFLLEKLKVLEPLVKDLVKNKSSNEPNENQINRVRRR